MRFVLRSWPITLPWSTRRHTVIRAARSTHPSLAIFVLLALYIAGGLLASPALPAHAQEDVAVVTIAADQETVVEGEEATFTLTRTGLTSGRLGV